MVSDTTGIISTIVGTTYGYSGDYDQATSAKLNGPTNVAKDSSGKYSTLKVNIIILFTYSPR